MRMFVWLSLAITAAGCLAAVDGEGASAEEWSDEDVELGGGQAAMMRESRQNACSGSQIAGGYEDVDGTCLLTCWNCPGEIGGGSGGAPDGCRTRTCDGPGGSGGGGTSGGSGSGGPSGSSGQGSGHAPPTCATHTDAWCWNACVSRHRQCEADCERELRECHPISEVEHGGFRPGVDYCPIGIDINWCTDRCRADFQGCSKNCSVKECH